MTHYIVALRMFLLSPRLTMLVATFTVFLVAADSACAQKGRKPGKPGGGSGPTYSLIQLVPPGVDITGSNAFDLDQTGNVVGYYDSGGQSFGFHNDLNQDQWQLFGAEIKVFGLNNRGEMVGVDDNLGEGLYWRSPTDQNPATLSPLPGHQTSRGVGINDNGILIGASDGVAVAWAANAAGIVSAPVELPWPVGDIRGTVTDLNEADVNGVTQIVGWSGFVYAVETAVRWEVASVAGVPVLVSGPSDLGSLDGSASGAYGINFFGDIVGRSGAWPFLKPAGGPMQALAGIRKATSGDALDINDEGNIVGSQAYLKRGVPVFKAVLWTSVNSVDDLNKKVNLGASEILEGAGCINSAGHILGSGFFPGVTESGNVGFLLVPLR